MGPQAQSPLSNANNIMIRGLVVCIIDHYPLGNQRTLEVSGVLNISEKLGRDSRCFADIASSRSTLVLLR